MNSFAKLKNLSLDEWKVLFASLFMLPFAALLLRFRGYTFARNVLLTKKSGYSEFLQIERLDEARRIARMVDAAASRGFCHATCLKRSLVLAWFLKKRGISFELIIGARKELEEGVRQSFSAHAWVETNGAVINDRGDVADRFTRFEAKVPGPV